MTHLTEEQLVAFRFGDVEAGERVGVEGHLEACAACRKLLGDIDVTLAAVDEGICQVKNYQTPDPYGYFYANMSRNAYIPPGQDATATGNWEHYANAKATTLLNRWKVTLAPAKQRSSKNSVGSPADCATPIDRATALHATMVPSHSAKIAPR